MITRTDKDSYAVTTMGREINLILSWDDLKARLLGCDVWTSGQVEDLKHLSVGDNTPQPRGRYV